METRIKIIKQGELTSRIPQSKGYMELWSGYDIPHKFFMVGVCLIPFLGQLLLIALICNYITSFWWTDLSNYQCYDSPEECIDNLYKDIEDVKTKRLKKKVEYIKYP